MTTTTLSESPAAPVPAPGLVELFWVFFTISIVAFGGVLPWARWRLVEERRWFSADEFLNLLALCQFLPGPNIVNLSIAVGARFRGLAGSAAAFLGIFGAPFIIIIVLGSLYDRWGDLASVRGALTGISAAASGMILAMAAKLALPLLRQRPKEAAPIIALVFVCVALLQYPLPLVLAVFLPLSVAIAWWRRT
jgi:chromate transporter